MTQSARKRFVAFLTIAGLAAALTLSAPASGGAPVLIEQTFMDLNLGQSYTAEPVEPFLFDNFTNEPTDIGNPIIGWGGVRVPIDLLAEDGPALARVTGVDGMIAPIEGLSEEATRDVYLSGLEAHAYSDPGGSAAFFRERSEGRPWNFGDLVDTGMPVPAVDPVLQESFDRFADQLHVADDPVIPNTRSSMFEAGTFQGDDLFEGDLDGYLLIGSSNEVDGAYLPRNYDEGADVLAVRQRDPFTAGPNGGRAENIIRIDIPDELVLPSGQAIGGAPAYNGSFEGDIFNGANTILGIRADPSAPTGNGQYETFAFSFTNGFWNEIDPFGNVGVSGDVTIFELPHQVLDGSSFGFATFVQNGAQQVQGAVGSSAAPSLPGLLDSDDLAEFAPRPFDIDIEQLVDDLEEAFGTSGVPTAEDPVSDDVVTEEPVDEDPASDDLIFATVTDDAGSDDSNTLPIVLIALGIILAAGGAYLSGLFNRDEDDDFDVCDWELHFLNGNEWKKLREAPPGSHACCIYKIQVETTTTMHIQAASFRQDVLPERTYIPDFDFSWSGLDFSGHAATRSGPAGRQDWMQGLGDTLDQSDLASEDGYWQSAQGEERPEVAARLVHRETTTITVELESGCQGSRSVYNGTGSGELNYLSTQECTNDDPAADCPVELNAFGSASGEVKGDLAWKLIEVTGTDIDELERDDYPRPLWDSHDHNQLDRNTHSAIKRGNDNNVIESLTWQAEVVNEVLLDAAQLVPQHVWPTTERVSTHVGGQMTYSLDLNGVMTKGDCEASGCCGHGGGTHTCNCDPSFNFALDGDQTSITVDGRTTYVGRDTEADRKNPPEWMGGGVSLSPIGVEKRWKIVPTPIRNLGP